MSRPRAGGDGGTDRAADRAAALKAAAEQEARAIYAGILARNPEHDFDPTLDRVASLMDLLGNPQHSFRAIHLTGTNGKTSTARMISALLSELGLRVGRFTSPHLHSVRERIDIDGAPISAVRFVEVWRDIEPYVAMVDAQLAEAGQSRLSFFEVLTGLAYAAFADAPIEVGVIEVGMGGSWDSTNVIDGDVAVVTPIARDHERWLGHTPAEIAGVKAGIIKRLEGRSQVVVTAEQPEEAAPVLAEAAATAGARIVAAGYDLEVANRHVAVGGQLIDLRTPAGLYTEIFLPLHGRHQAENAALALTAVESFLGGGTLDPGVVEAGFAAVTSPGRLEVIRSSPTVLVDGAHNPAAAVVLVDAIEEAFAFSRLVGVVGVMADKDAEGLLSVLEPLLDEIVLTQAPTPRAMDAGDLAEIARDVFDEDVVHVAAGLSDAITLAADLAEQGEVDAIASRTGVLVTGSVLLAAQARAIVGLGD
ncbi:dihydrofolate synthase [Pseudactinotalea sp. HY160]|uniref:bifunctional folylpolyglutamate synthase/dihydrofolate synthase n=1 Tax=Pseudactinotalea sp. HY160 TaxID=2654490 RepID=UPI00131294EE|nr:dihydrofolate synthase [Pseudactinotalea sp. HY160]